MNKQEALKQIEEQRDMILELHGWGVFGYIKGIINQLDEPQKIELPKVDFKKSQKVKVKQFVADWYEENKDGFEGNLYRFAYNSPSALDSAKLNEFKRWFLTAGTKPFQTLVNMHQFGYEVEEEKRYYVRFKWIEDSYSYLTLIKHLHAWTLKNITLDKKFRTAHTRKELEEAGFGWVFDCEGVEIEEVGLCH